MSNKPLSTPSLLTMYAPLGDYLNQLLRKITSKGSFAAHKIRLLAALEPQWDSFATARTQINEKHCDKEPVDPADESQGTKPRIYIDDAGNSIVKFSSTEQREAHSAEFILLLEGVKVSIDLKANPILNAALIATLAKLEGDDCPEIEPQFQGTFFQLLNEITAALATESK